MIGPINSRPHFKHSFILLLITLFFFLSVLPLNIPYELFKSYEYTKLNNREFFYIFNEIKIRFTILKFRISEQNSQLPLHL